MNHRILNIFLKLKILEIGKSNDWLKQQMTESLTLLNSSSPQFLEQVFLRVYQTRLDGVNSSLIDSVSNQLEIDSKKGASLLENILEISKQAVYYNLSEKETVFTFSFF